MFFQWLLDSYSSKILRTRNQHPYQSGGEVSNYVTDFLFKENCMGLSQQPEVWELVAVDIFGQSQRVLQREQMECSWKMFTFHSCKAVCQCALVNILRPLKWLQQQLLNRTLELRYY